MPGINSVTVDELLPAMIELASIQHDLLSMEIPALEGNRSATLYPTMKKTLDADATLERRRVLLQRSHVLLSWLVGKARSPR